MKRILLVSLAVLASAGLGGVLLSCSGGGGGGSGGNGGDNGTEVAGPAPTVVWSVESDAKNPVTDLAACAETVMACVKGGTALADCFGTEGLVCPDPTPSDGCCMQACGDQLAQRLDAGVPEQDAFLEVFVYDGSCMPGILEAANR